MLYIVLALVVAAFGLLIAALTTANTVWAWISVIVSVVAAALLVTDWLSGRRKARAKESAKPTVVTVGGARRDDSPREPDDEDLDEDLADQGDLAPGPEFDTEVTGHIEPVADDRVHRHADDRVGDYADGYAGRVDDRPADRADDRPADVADDQGEPDEEPTDASDLLVVAGLNVEVRVVDEHPRYHLPTCSWLGPRPTIPIPVSEARQLGFTPCARCGPDGVLAARHRAAR